MLLMNVLWAWAWIFLGAHVGLVSGASSNNGTTPANSKHIKTSSLLTCMENSQFTASTFDVKFFPNNQTIVFNVDATTTITGNVTLRAEIITYGLNVYQASFDLCSLDEVSVCPLSAGRIELSSSYQLTDNDLTKQIPNVAYTIPDLDAQVRVVVYAKNDTQFETPLACVLAILSNDKTVQTKYASWPIAAISGVGILTSAFVSVIGYSATSAHIASNSISLFIYFQSLAITAMMGVSRVPPIAAAWTQNFQWSMGIIRAEFMQKIFNWYVQATNGVSTVVVANKDILSISVQKRMAQQLFRRAVSIASSSDFNYDNLLSDKSLYTTTERNTTEYASRILVLRGIERVAFKADIELSNFFLTGIVFFLFFLFCMIIILTFFKALLEVLTRARLMSQTTNFFQYRKNWASIVKGTLYRFSVIAYPQLTLLTIWEFTQVDSPAVVVDAVVVLAVFTGLLLYGTIRVIVKARQSTRLYKTPAYLLYGDIGFLNKFGFLYSQFHSDQYWWLVILLIYSFLRSLFVAVLQNQGKAQALIVFIIELFYFVALCWIRPYLDKRTNAFNISIHLVTTINSLLFLFFSNLFKQPPVVSSVMAVILFVLNAVFALFLLLFTIITCAIALVHRNPDARYSPMKDDRVSFIPKIQFSESTDALKNLDSENMELYEMGKLAMDTNESDQEKSSRMEKLGVKTTQRTLFDDESSFGESSGGHNARPYSGIDAGSIDAVQPTSAVMGGTSHHPVATPKYEKSSSHSSSPNRNEQLRRPETSFYNNSSSNPFSSRNNTFL